MLCTSELKKADKEGGDGGRELKYQGGWRWELAMAMLVLQWSMFFSYTVHSGAGMGYLMR